MYKKFIGLMMIVMGGMCCGMQQETFKMTPQTWRLLQTNITVADIVNPKPQEHYTAELWDAIQQFRQNPLYLVLKNHAQQQDQKD